MNSLFALYIVYFIYYTSSQNVKRASSSYNELRIVGGSVATEVPDYYVALISAKNEVKRAVVRCGSTLITNNHLLTAAHCYLPKHSSILACRKYVAVLKLQNRCRGEYGKVVSIKECYIHPNYSTVTYRHDIAIITLNKKANYSPAMFPIINGKLITFSQLDNMTVTIFGYGDLKAKSSKTPCRIHEAEVSVMPSSICKTKEIGGPLFPESMLCAASRDYDIDSCQGDSGGPMIYEHENQDFLVGITSFGMGCAEPNKPGVYTFVPYYEKWIKSELYKEEENSFSMFIIKTVLNLSHLF